MTRRLLNRGVLLLILLSGGAIVNVAVAWGCATIVQNRSFSPNGTIDASVMASYLTLEAAEHVRYANAILNHSSTGANRYDASVCSGLYCHYTVVRCGLPMTSLYGWKYEQDVSSNKRDGLLSISASQDIELPLKVAMPGFAINTIFYAAVLWVMFVMPFALRRRLRTRRGLCPACAYPIGSSPVCTECGTLIKLRSTN